MAGDAHGLVDIWQPRFEISQRSSIATLGSCFAQHIGKQLTARGYRWVDGEPAPFNFPADQLSAYHYGTFSARFGNIYTSRLLRQWIDWTLGIAPVVTDVHRSGDRFFDLFRPTIEPNGFASIEELVASRDNSLCLFSRLLQRCDLLMFTMGLTESWINRRDGTVYPMCPGTAAGEYNPDLHAFHNQGYDEIVLDLNHAFDAIRAANPRMRFVLTVSPVPLTVTATDDHVLPATVYSKSVLRAAAGMLRSSRDDTDYFPSYEIITTPASRGMWYDGNLRTVNPDGVARVMDSFFGAIHAPDGNSATASQDGGFADMEASIRDEVCEEIMLQEQQS